MSGVGGVEDVTFLCRMRFGCRNEFGTLASSASRIRSDGRRSFEVRWTERGTHENCRHRSNRIHRGTSRPSLDRRGPRGDMPCEKPREAQWAVLEWRCRGRARRCVRTGYSRSGPPELRRCLLPHPLDGRCGQLPGCRPDRRQEFRSGSGRGWRRPHNLPRWTRRRRRSAVGAPWEPSRGWTHARVGPGSGNRAASRSDHWIRLGLV